ncbi:MAG: tyrosine-type recombinase/integrase [Dehalococcoidia bacterium]|nr:tyrosine-type recombinase/integrase [Dehalococcoidia bacterium]
MRTEEAIRIFLDNCRARNLKPSTISWYRQRLVRFSKCYPELPEVIDPIETFLAGINGSAESKHSYFRTLRALYYFIEPRYHIANPIKGGNVEPRRQKKVMPTLEPDEAMRFLLTAGTLRDRALFTLFLDTGIRTIEAATLRQSRVREDSVIVDGKSGELEVPISEETRRLLLALIAQVGPQEYVFTNGRGGPLSRHTVYKLVRDHMKTAGIYGPKLGAHRLRHTFGRGYLVAGGDTRSLQRIMGHKDLMTTERYVNLGMRDIVAKHHRHTPLRLIHSAAQASLFASEMIKEAEGIITKSPETRKSSPPTRQQDRLF